MGGKERAFPSTRARSITVNYIDAEPGLAFAGSAARALHKYLWDGFFRAATRGDGKPRDHLENAGDEGTVGARFQQGEFPSHGEGELLDGQRAILRVRGACH